MSVPAGRILVVDDERAIGIAIQQVLEERGHTVDVVRSGEDAVRVAGEERPDVVVTDLTLPGLSGMELLGWLREHASETAVVMITAYGSERTAVEAMKRGAVDYLPKPFDNDELQLVVDRALEGVLLRRDVRQLREQVAGPYRFENLVGRSPAMQRVFDVVRKVADTDLTVLVHGPSGSGKELVANALHHNGRRRTRPFVKVNCAAFSRELVESELFGHERGAFTGAVGARAGKFESANGGTLLLDEIGDMPLETQAKILRVLQEGEIQRVGSDRTLAVDVRIVAATNHDLAAAVRDRTFREDLYYRLNVVSVRLPALRERTEDLPLLIEHFLASATARVGCGPRRLGPDAYRALLAHDWPGNVRELEHALERGVALASGDVIAVDDLPDAVRGATPTAESPWGALPATFKEAKQLAVERFERGFVTAALARHQGNVSKAAEEMGMYRQHLQVKLAELAIDAETFPASRRVTVEHVEALQLLAAGVAFVPALVWTVIARSWWRFRRAHGLRHPFSRLVALCATALAIAYFVGGVAALVPPAWGPPTTAAWPAGVIALYLTSQWAMIGGLAFAYHWTAWIAGQPSPVALRVNYGAAVTMMFFGLVFPLVLPAATLERQVHFWLASLHVYLAVMLVATFRNIRRARRPRGGSTAGLYFVFGRIDAVLYVIGIVGLVAAVVEFVLVEDDALSGTPSFAGILVVFLGWLFAVPTAMRMLRVVVRGVVVTGAVLAACAVTLAAAEAMLAHAPFSDAPLLVRLLTLVALVTIAVPGQRLVRGAVDGLVLRRPRRQRARLQQFLQSLSPELGAAECARRALAELVRVLGLRGAALLPRAGEPVAVGDIAIADLAAAWPAGTAAHGCPATALVARQYRELPTPLQDLLVDAGVVAVAPVASPRRPTGHVVLTAGLVGADLDEEEVLVLQGFCDQLALVLEAAELLSRTVAVERSLAHAEKLAAIGELTARIVHDIRNPLAAARSLTAHLARAPQADVARLHGVILEELERIERQVADLLRFARRDDLRLEPVDVAALLRGTAAQFAMRLDAAGIELTVTAPRDVEICIDREKVRQALANLVENAMDALAERPAGARRIELAAAVDDDGVVLRVSDNGPGAPPDVAARLFEPFYSGKPHGTGLGLAIVRRTIEAHGGRIHAEPGDGMTFWIGLPGKDRPDERAA